MGTPIPLSGLAEALDPSGRELISLVGGGGKTTLLFSLGRQLSGRVVLTTTTKMGADQTGGAAVLDDPSGDQLESTLVAGSDPVLVRKAVDGHKAIGVDPTDCNHWFDDLDAVDHVVVEADGARRHPFTAPRPFEPVVPTSTTLLVACMGADALGRVIADQCHCPLRVAAAAGCSPYRRLTPERAARVLVSERGSAKGKPPGARLVVVVTKVDDVARPAVDELVGLLEPEVSAIAVAFDRNLGGGYPPDR